MRYAAVSVGLLALFGCDFEVGGQTHASSGSGGLGGSMGQGASTSQGAAPAVGGMGGLGGGGAAGGAGGVAGPVVQVIVHGDFDTEATQDVASLAFPGPVKTTFVLDKLVGDADIELVAVSPDGSVLAVAGVNVGNNASVLYGYAADGTGDAVTLAEANAPEQNFEQLAFSPDGAWLAFIADIEVNGQDRLYIVPSDGSSDPVALSPDTGATLLDVESFVWARSVSSTSGMVAYVGDLVTNGVQGVWTVDAIAAAAPVEIVAQGELSEDADVADLLDFDAQGRVYFKGDFESDDLFRLYRADADGTDREMMPGTALIHGNGPASIGTFGLSPDGLRLAFSCESPDQGNYRVFTMDVTASAADVVSSITTGTSPGSEGPSFFSLVAWSPDGTRLAVAADWTVDDSPDNSFSAFVLPSSGAPGGIRVLGAPSDADRDVDRVAFSADSSRLFVLGDLTTDTDLELYAITLFEAADQDARVVRVEDVPAGGDVDGFVISP